MDKATENHLRAWLENHVAEADQHWTENAIRELLIDYPTLIDEGRSWPEILNLAERKS